MLSRIWSGSRFSKAQRAFAWTSVALICFLLGATSQVHAPSQDAALSVLSLPLTETATATSPTDTPTLTPTATVTPTDTPSATPTLPPLPKIVSSYPIDGDRSVSRDAIIVIALSGDVDQQQVEATFTFSPTLSGEVSLARSPPGQFPTTRHGRGQALQVSTSRCTIAAKASNRAKSSPRSLSAARAARRSLF